MGWLNRRCAGVPVSVAPRRLPMAYATERDSSGLRSRTHRLSLPHARGKNVHTVGETPLSRAQFTHYDRCTVIAYTKGA